MTPPNKNTSPNAPSTYLNLAYLSPRIVNQLLNGTLTINLQTLFDIASKNLSFEEQEKMLSI